MRKHYVTFLSPGTLYSEEATRPVPEWSTREAVRLAADVVERHGAKPYAFYFTTCLTAGPVPDGEGGVLEVKPKEVARSGNYFLGGALLTLDELKARNDPGLRILIGNMECNGWPIVVENRNSYRATQPFTDRDFIVDGAGKVAERGDDPGRVAYRERKIAEHKREVEKEMAAWRSMRKSP